MRGLRGWLGRGEPQIAQITQRRVLGCLASGLRPPPLHGVERRVDCGGRGLRSERGRLRKRAAHAELLADLEAEAGVVGQVVALHRDEIRGDGLRIGAGDGARKQRAAEAGCRRSRHAARPVRPIRQLTSYPNRRR